MKRILVIAGWLLAVSPQIVALFAMGTTATMAPQEPSVFAMQLELGWKQAVPAVAVLLVLGSVAFYRALRSFRSGVLAGAGFAGALFGMCMASFLTTFVMLADTLPVVCPNWLEK